MEYPCRKCSTTYCYQNCDEFNKWLEEAEAAMEKQIPMQVNDIECHLHYDGECPVCGTAINNDDNNVLYCCHCGQKLNWKVKYE